MARLREMLLGLSAGAVVALSAVPAVAQDIVDVISRDPQLSQFAALIKAAGLEQALKGKGPLTILAPTDTALRLIATEQLLQPANKPALAAVVRFHVLPGDYSRTRLAGAVVPTLRVETAEGSSVLVDATAVQAAFKRQQSEKSVPLAIEGVSIAREDIKASNGTVYVIETALLPAKQRQLRLATPAPARAAPAAAPAPVPAPAKAPPAPPAPVAAPVVEPAAPPPAVPVATEAPAVPEAKAAVSAPATESVPAPAAAEPAAGGEPAPK